MEKPLLEKLIKLITFIPGIMGLASLDVSAQNTPLKEGDYHKSFTFDEEGEKLNIAVGIIVNHDIPMQVVAAEVFSSINGFLKSQKTRLGKINIYVRGIK